MFRRSSKRPSPESAAAAPAAELKEERPIRHLVPTPSSSHRPHRQAHQSSTTIKTIRLEELPAMKGEQSARHSALFDIIYAMHLENASLKTEVFRQRHEIADLKTRLTTARTALTFN